MIVRITSKRQVTFPKRVMEKLNLRAGDTLSIEETSEGFVLRPNRFNEGSLAPLKHLVTQGLASPDLDAIREGAAHDSSLRN